MSGIAVGGALLGGLVLLLIIRVPIAVAMLVAGMAGYAALAGTGPLLGWLKGGAYDRFADYGLSVVPLFVLMGQFAVRAGLSRALFDAAQSWLGHRRGGLALAAVGACAGFGAVCGSSLATAATMAKVALPEMRRHGYPGGLATGTLAAGGTLGILIPPSLVLVLYAVLTEQSVGKMFVAALLPGLLAVLGYMVAASVAARRLGLAAPAPASATARRRGLATLWPVAAIFALVIGGIYGGWFTPTEGAAVGAGATGLLALARRRLDRAALADCLLETASITAMIFLILLGAEIFNAALALSRLPQIAADAVAGSGWPPLAVVGAILVLFLALGCVMDSLSMILLTVPILFPVVAGLDLGLPAEETAIWFGVLALIAVEVGLITPPVGLNVFVINALARDVPLSASFRGVVPFFLSDLARIALLVAFPSISLGLVRLLG